MTYVGKVTNGVVVLDGNATLAEGTVVRVEPVEAGFEAPTLAERLESVIGIAKGLPPDLAENHDHYLHGRPTK